MEKDHSTQKPKERTSVAKGTHHGAINSFNEDLFWQIMSENYITSAED